MKLEGIRVQGLEQLDSTQRCILVDARQFVESVRVFGVLGNRLVQLRNRFFDLAG
jgi:hypothetical protein